MDKVQLAQLAAAEADLLAVRRIKTMSVEATIPGLILSYGHGVYSLRTGSALLAEGGMQVVLNVLSPLKPGLELVENFA